MKKAPYIFLLCPTDVYVNSIVQKCAPLNLLCKELKPDPTNYHPSFFTIKFAQAFGTVRGKEFHLRTSVILQFLQLLLASGYVGSCQTGQQQPQHLKCHLIRIWSSTNLSGSAGGLWLDRQGRWLEWSNQPVRMALLEMDLSHQYHICCEGRS